MPLLPKLAFIFCSAFQSGLNPIPRLLGTPIPSLLGTKRRTILKQPSFCNHSFLLT